MTETVEMLESETRGVVVVELDGDDAGAALVAGDGDERDGKRLGDGGVDGDDAFDGAGDEHARIAVEELGAVAVADDEVEEAGLEQLVLDAGEDGGGVALADFGDDDANGVSAAFAEAAGDGVGGVTVLGCGGENTLAGGRGDAILLGLTVDDAGDGGGRELEERGEFLEGDGARRRLGHRADLPTRESCAD